MPRFSSSPCTRGLHQSRFAAAIFRFKSLIAFPVPGRLMCFSLDQPRLMQGKSLPMPSNDRIRLDDNHRFQCLRASNKMKLGTVPNFNATSCSLWLLLLCRV